MSPELEWLSITLAWTAIVAVFAWLGASRLRVAHSTREFDFFFRGLQEAEWPLLFQIAKGFLTIWTGLGFLMAAIGCALVLKAIVKLFQ